jgi:sigma-E factor negative regulatory protein RseB
MASAQRMWRWLVAGLLCGSLLPAGAAGAAAPPSLDAAGWIARLNTAAAEHNYRGTMVYTAAGVVSSSRVAHACNGDQVFERIEALDGHEHRVYRHNETVQTVWPHKRLVVVEQRAAAPGLVSTRRRVEPRALQHYTLTTAGQSVVAGRRAQVLMLQPRDDLRFAQRLLVDEATGLLLRADVLDSDARVLESSAFSEVDIGWRTDPRAVIEGMNPAGYTVLPSRREIVDWSAQGWRLRQTLPGFQLVGSLRRPAVGGSGDGTALQAMFSDGLSFVSLFIEPYREQAHRSALSAGLGATHTVMQRVGDHWITAMGDVPRRTLENFVSALEHR